MGLDMALEPRLFRDPIRIAPGFLESTGGTLLIGRVIAFRGLGEQLLARWDAWSALLDDERARAVPAHDLSRFEEYVGFDGWFRVAVGVPIATQYADDGPSAAIDEGRIHAARARAKRVLDPRTIERLAEGLAAPDAWSLRNQETRALLVPFGPIASARLAWGTIASVLEPVPAGLTRVRGADMRHHPHDLAIDGALVTAACDWDIREPELERPRGVEGELHLVPRYG